MMSSSNGGHASSSTDTTGSSSIDGRRRLRVIGDDGSSIQHPSAVSILPFLQAKATTSSESSKDNNNENNENNKTCGGVQQSYIPPPMPAGCASSLSRQQFAQLASSEQEQVLQSYAHSLKCMAGRRGHQHLVAADGADDGADEQRNQKVRLFDKALKKFAASSSSGARSAGASENGTQPEMKETGRSRQNQTFSPKKANHTKGTSKKEMMEDMAGDTVLTRTSKQANDTKGGADTDQRVLSSSPGAGVKVAVQVVLPLSKLKVQGNALKKLYNSSHSIHTLDQRQEALRFCDQAAVAVIQSKQQKIRSPTGFIIGALLKFEAKTKMKSNNACAQRATSSSKACHDVSESTSSLSLSSSSSSSSSAALPSSFLLLPQSKLKLQGDALKMLHSLVPLDQHEEALLFCDAAAIKMFQCKQKIRSPTGFFIKTLQSFQNKMKKKCAAAPPAEPTAGASRTPNTSFSDVPDDNDDDNSNNNGGDDRRVIAQLRREMDNIKGRLQAKSNQCQELKKQLESATAAAQEKLQQMELTITQLHDAIVKKDDMITSLQETVVRAREESQDTTKMLIQVQGELILAQQEQMTSQKEEHQAALSVEMDKRQTTMLAAKDLELQQMKRAAARQQEQEQQQQAQYEEEEAAPMIHRWP